MEKILVNKKPPKKVIEKEEVHYFYWPIELGLLRIKLFNKNINLPIPIQFHDYEPIKVIKSNNKYIVASRFHYNVLLYFNNPKLLNKKAIADFSFGSHSPYIHSKIDSKLGSIISPTLEAVELKWFSLLYIFYQQIVSGKIDIEIKDTYDYELEEEDIPKEIIFDINKCNSIIWLGKTPEERDTPSDIWNFIRE